MEPHYLNDIQSEKTQKRLTTKIFKNRILAASDYITVYTIKFHNSTPLSLN